MIVDPYYGTDQHVDYHRLDKPGLDIGPSLASVKKLERTDSKEEYLAWAAEMMAIFNLCGLMQ
jgi:hypothetical protein